MISIIGLLIAGSGHVRRYGEAPYSMPANSFRRDQAARIPLHFSHDRSWPIGEVGHLERSKAGLMLVGRLFRDDLADMLVDHEWYLSDSTNCRPMGTMEMGQGRINEVSLVPATANRGTGPIRWSRHDIGIDGGGQPRGMPLPWYGTWDRAHERMSAFAYQRSDRMDILDLDELGGVEEVLTDPAAAIARSRAVDAAKPAKAAKLRAEPTPRTQPMPEEVGRIYRHTYPALIDQG